MKKRIDKKIHYKYLSDVFLEFALNSWKGIPVDQMDIGELIIVDSSNIPKSFYKLFPEMENYKFRYL